MAKSRPKIPEHLAAEVLFASDRTCCVCRAESKVQIHHIDGDPSNNASENLAVVCLHCHSEAHTSGAFVRNLTPELIRLYSDSWRDIVRLRIQPRNNVVQDVELSSEALLEISLDCHSWKVWFMSITEHLPSDKASNFQDVWDLMMELWIPPFSQPTYRKYVPIFADGLTYVIQRFDRSIQLFVDSIPIELQLMLLRGNRQLAVEKATYIKLPNMIEANVVEEKQIPPIFYGRFVGVIRVLRDVSRSADAFRQALLTDDA